MLTCQLLTGRLLTRQMVPSAPRGTAAVDSPALPEEQEPPPAAAASAALAGLRPALRERLLPSAWASATVKGATYSHILADETFYSSLPMIILLIFHYNNILMLNYIVLGQRVQEDRK